MGSGIRGAGKRARKTIKTKPRHLFKWRDLHRIIKSLTFEASEDDFAILIDVARRTAAEVIWSLVNLGVLNEKTEAKEILLQLLSELVTLTIEYMQDYLDISLNTILAWVMEKASEFVKGERSGESKESP